MYIFKEYSMCIIIFLAFFFHIFKFFLFLFLIFLKTKKKTMFEISKLVWSPIRTYGQLTQSKSRLTLLDRTTNNYTEYETIIIYLS